MIRQPSKPSRRDLYVLVSSIVLGVLGIAVIGLAASWSHVIGIVVGVGAVVKGCIGAYFEIRGVVRKKGEKDSWSPHKARSGAAKAKKAVYIIFDILLWFFVVVSMETPHWHSRSGHAVGWSPQCSSQLRPY